MGELYDRRIELHVYTELFAGGQKTIIKTDGKGNSLDIEFNVEDYSSRKKKSQPNIAKITIINLEPDHRNMFAESHQAVELYAGYKDDIGMIFVGETTNVINTQEPTRWLTEIYAGDGIKDWTTKLFANSYSAGTKVSQILSDMIAATDLPSLIDDFPDETILAGESYSGLVKDVLTELTADHGLEWSIQWGTIEVTLEDSELTKDAAVEILAPDTGLLTQPALIERTTQKKSKKTKQKRKFGIRAKSLMNYRIKPRRVVQIESGNTVNAVGKFTTEKAPPADVNGLYVVDTCKYFGSNFGKEFYVEIEADLQ